MLYGKTLKEERTEHEVSLRELARHLGISHVVVSEVETGKRPALADRHIPKLVEVLGYDYPLYWQERWRRIAIFSRLEHSGHLETLTDHEIESIKRIILDDWTDRQVASGRFRDDT